MTTHAAEGTLQAYLDRELGGAEAAALEGHLRGCPACAAELEALGAAAERFRGAVRLLDDSGSVTAPPLPVEPITARRPAAWAASRRLLARAAAVVVLLAAGTALLEATTGVVSSILDRVGFVFERPERPVAPSSEPPAVRVESPTRGFDVAARNGVVRIGVQDAAPGLVLRVRITEVEPATVRLVGGTDEAVFQAGSGWGAVRPADASAVEISLPRSLARARVEVNGRPYLTKSDGALSFAVAPADTTGGVMEFRVVRP